jgi:hypothetical protein
MSKARPSPIPENEEPILENQLVSVTSVYAIVPPNGFITISFSILEKILTERYTFKDDF